jgi:excisionase family DNA binding protein
VSKQSLTKTSVASPWLTADEAAEYLRLPSRRALYQAVRRGAFPSHRRAGFLRFHKDELDEALLGGAQRRAPTRS